MHKVFSNSKAQGINIEVLESAKQLGEGKCGEETIPSLAVLKSDFEMLPYLAG